MDEIESLETSTDALGRTAGSAARMTDVFAAELRRANSAIGETARGLDGLERGFSGGVRRAIDSVVLDGGRLSDALGLIGQAMSRTAYDAAMKPVATHFGGLLSNGVNALLSGVQPFADGAAFSAGRVSAFARGGVVSGATTFPMRGGTGLMGEAGPEAIMPLSRTADGRLGVAAQGGGAVTVTMNITTPDVAGFRRSQGQIAAQMARAIGQGARNR